MNVSADLDFPLASPSCGVFALGFIDLGWRNFRLVGSSGLEPPTSRLSGARSNHLSYEPTLVFGVSRLSNRRRHCRPGGDDGNRTHDPLLAGQVLSQLSYTPIFLGLFL